VGGLDRAQPLARQRFAQDLQRQVGDGALVLVELEVHVFLSQWRGTRGMPRPKSAIRSRWTSFVPPPNVRNSVPWYARSRRPRSGATPVPRSTPAEPNTSSRSRYASQKNSVPNTLVALESAGLIEALVTAFQLISFKNSSRACTRARFIRPHSWSMTRRPSASRASAAHRTVSS